MMECPGGVVNMGQPAPAMGITEQVGCQEQKRAAGLPRLEFLTGRRQTEWTGTTREIQKDWITLTSYAKTITQWLTKAKQRVQYFR